MSGKLIVIDGLDGSGKSTQAKRLYDILERAGKQVKLISFPDYEQPSSVLVRMYLSGEFSQNADDINAYAASSFYAVDRYASYIKYWRDFYESGGLVIATRYVSSNAIHQMGKLPQEKWDVFLNWLSDYEYEKLGLPRPDRILFLDMPRNVADRLIEKRYGGDESKKDIHEKNRKYLEQCGCTAAYAAKKEDWTVIPCAQDGSPRTQEAITEEIMKILKKELYA